MRNAKTAELRPLTGYALVTGASAGIGAAFARQLAAQTRHLVLVARNAQALGALAEDLTRRYGVTVEVLPADLSTDAGCAAVTARIMANDKPIDTVINNAGQGMARPFGDVPLTDEEHLLDLNVRAVLALSHAAVTAMVPRGHGQIINISSVAPMVPRAVTATYSASKAWVTSFTESLALRLAGTGVTATVVCPGLTRSEFHQRSGEDVSGRPALLWLRPERVVAEALAAANAGRILNVPSRRYRLLMLLAQHAPRSVVRAVTAQR